MMKFLRRVFKRNKSLLLTNPMSEKGKLAKISDRMVNLAYQEIGVHEVNGSNCGVRVDQYKAATWLDPKKGWPWCAAFICWLVREATKNEKTHFKNPRTAGAWDFENWANKQGTSVNLKKPHEGDIKSGDIVIFTFSHIGLAVSGVDKDGNVETIEGNTNDAGSREGGSVLKKERPASKIRSRIRILS